MKTIRYQLYSILLCTATLLFSACEKDEDRAILRQGSAPQLSASAATVSLKSTDADNEAITFKWTPISYGFNAADKSWLQFDKKGNNFTKAITIDITDSLEKSYTVADFNALAIQRGLPIDATGELEARIKSEIPYFTESTYSNIITISVGTYLRSEATPVLSATPETVVLTQGESSKTAVVFNWTHSDFEASEQVEYYLEIDRKGNNFAAPKIVALEDSVTKKYTHSDFNNLAIQLGITAGTTGDLEARIRTNIVSLEKTILSKILSMTVTTYNKTVVSYPTMYMVGEATEADWDGNLAMPMTRSESDQDLYTYTGYLDQGSLKFIAYRNQWVPMWGYNTETTAVFREKESDPDPGNFWIPNNGMYTIKLNVRTLTYSMEVLPSPVRMSVFSH